jgi:hypothetical protein
MPLIMDDSRLNTEEWNIILNALSDWCDQATANAIADKLRVLIEEANYAAHPRSRK